MRLAIVLILSTLTVHDAISACVVQGVSTQRLRTLLDLLVEHPEAARRGGIELESMRNLIAVGINQDQLQSLLQPGGRFSYSTLLRLRRNNATAFRSATASHSDPEGVQAIYAASFPIMQSLEASGCSGSGRAASQERAGATTSTGRSRGSEHGPERSSRIAELPEACRSASLVSDATSPFIDYLNRYEADLVSRSRAHTSEVTSLSRRAGLVAALDHALQPSGPVSPDHIVQVTAQAERENSAMFTRYDAICDALAPGPTRENAACRSFSGRPVEISDSTRAAGAHNDAVAQAIVSWEDQYIVDSSMRTALLALQSRAASQRLVAATNVDEVRQALANYERQVVGHFGSDRTATAEVRRVQIQVNDRINSCITSAAATATPTEEDSASSAAE